MKRLVAGLRLVRPLWRTVIAGVAALMLAGGYLAVGTTVARADGGAARPGITTVQVSSNGGVVTFTTYPGMASCKAVYLSDCFEFTDGTVVGVLNPLVVLDEVGDVLPASLAPVFNSPAASQLTRPCVTLPQLGTSDKVMDVFDGTTERLALSDHGCAELESVLARGSGVVSDIIGPGIDHQIKPLDPPSAAEARAQTGLDFICEPDGFGCGSA